MIVQCAQCAATFDVVFPAEHRLKFAIKMIPDGEYICEECCEPGSNPKGGGVWRPKLFEPPPDEPFPIDGPPV